MTAYSVRLWRRLRALRAELPLLGLWAGALAGIEVLGRRSRSEASDLIAVVLLVMLALLTARQHAARPVAWVGWLLDRCRALVRWVRRHRISIGIDLRGRPPLARSLPAPLAWAVLGVTLGLAVLWAFRDALPGGLRGALLVASPSLLALYHLALWSWLGLCVLLLYFLPLMLVGEALERSPRWRPRRRRIHGWIGLGYALALGTGAWLLPVWVPLALSAALLLGLGLLALSRGVPRTPILWKVAGAAGPPASFPWTWLIIGQGVIHQGVLCSSALLALGDRVLGPGGAGAPISNFLGLVLAWSIPGAFLANVHDVVGLLVRARGEERARRRGPRVLVQGPAPGPVRAGAQEALRRAGFDAVPPSATPERTDVRLLLAEGPLAAGDPARAGWPRLVTPSELESPELHAKLRRRWEQLCRRTLVRGIERAFKAAARTSYGQGSGFWVAPHCPFMPHLTRDVDDNVSGWIGEPWRRLIPRAARQHWQDVMEGLELDLLFVEDGVRFRELKRVLALLFEHYDIFGPTRLEDLRLFAGLPRLRIVVHEFVLEEPFRASGYPEADYEHLGRARILHVYRDRGGDEEPAPVPADLDRMPSPLVPMLA